MSAEATHAYIGVKECGCCVAATVDMPSEKKHTAEAVAEFILSGLKIEHVTIPVARERFMECPHKPPACDAPKSLQTSLGL